MAIITQQGLPDVFLMWDFGAHGLPEEGSVSVTWEIEGNPQTQLAWVPCCAC